MIMGNRVSKAKVLALVPARGGSKRLPGKNMKLLGGKHLINWTLDIALSSELFCDVLVSTDDSSIAEEAKNGALVPWLRPASMATDSATSVDVALHALNWYESNITNVDALMLLQPTSPFRTVELLKNAIEMLFSTRAQSVLSVVPALVNPAWCFYQVDGILDPCMGMDLMGKASQDLPPAYMLDGSIYIITPDALRDSRSFILSKSRAILSPEEMSIDIDTQEDWDLAEEKLAHIFGLNNKSSS